MSRSLSRSAPVTLLLLAISVPSAAAAQVYGALSLGPAKVQDMNFRDPATADLLLDVKASWHLSGTLGYRWSPSVRTELSLGYLDGKITGAQRQNIVTIAACGLTPNAPCISGAVRGSVKNTTVLAMGFVDLVTPGPIVPYFGLGAGIGRESQDINATITSGPMSGEKFAIVDDGELEFAMRAAAGVTIDLGNVEADVGYTFTRMSKPALTGRSTFISFVFDQPLRSHAVSAALRFGF